MQAAPARFEGLKFGMMQDQIQLGAEGAVDIGVDRFDQPPQPEVQSAGIAQQMVRQHRQRRAHRIRQIGQFHFGRRGRRVFQQIEEIVGAAHGIS